MGYVKKAISMRRDTYEVLQKLLRNNEEFRNFSHMIEVLVRYALKHKYGIEFNSNE